MAIFRVMLDMKTILLEKSFYSAVCGSADEGCLCKWHSIYDLFKNIELRTRTTVADTLFFPDYRIATPISQSSLIPLSNSVNCFLGLPFGATSIMSSSSFSKNKSITNGQ